MTETVEVIQADRTAGHDHAVIVGRIPPVKYRAAFESGEWDETEDVQAFARHRLEAIESATKAIKDIVDGWGCTETEWTLALDALRALKGSNHD